MTNGWARQQLGQVAELRGRIGWRGLTAKEYTEKGPIFLSVHSLNYGDFVDFRDAFHISAQRYAESPEIMLRTDDVLICKDGAGIGKVGIVGCLPDCATINSSLLLVRADSSVLPKYLYRYLSSPQFQRIVASRLNGATTPHLYQRDIAEFPILIPPITEQARIVCKLDEATGAIATAKANTEKNLQNSRALFESHLDSVFSRCDEGWVEKTIGEICDLRSGTTLSQRLEKNEGQIPYLKVADMNISHNSSGITCSSRYVNRADVKPSNLMSVGTTIFPKRGGAILTNKKRLTKRVICADLNIMGVRPRSGLLPEFLFNYFRRLDLRQINNGSSIPQINNYNIEPLVIRFPISIIEQQTIVVRLAALSDRTTQLESAYETKIAALDQLKNSILHQAFTGAL